MSTLPTPFSKPLLVQANVGETLHNRGNVIAEKAILLALKNDIVKNNCSAVKRIVLSIRAMRGVRGAEKGGPEPKKSRV
ncbi:MAG: hypothetical protein HGA67_03915 [Candidatus Yonathbacteria bacterium]|nr:hypothetical protein [Candidatus Yonathbacteria bacterium]